MERELASKIFILEYYNSKENMEEQIKEFIYMLRIKYPSATITREFYRGQNILVRATEVSNKEDTKQIENEKEVDDW